jgi:hypothetical protein
MPVSEGQKINALEKAVKIAEAAAGSGTPGCVSDANLASIIKTTYDQMLEIIETINQK